MEKIKLSNQWNTARNLSSVKLDLVVNPSQIISYFTLVCNSLFAIRTCYSQLSLKRTPLVPSFGVRRESAIVVVGVISMLACVAGARRERGEHARERADTNDSSRV